MSRRATALGRIIKSLGHESCVEIDQSISSSLSAISYRCQDRHHTTSAAPRSLAFRSTGFTNARLQRGSPHTGRVTSKIDDVSISLLDSIRLQLDGKLPAKRSALRASQQDGLVQEREHSKESGGQEDIQRGIVDDYENWFRSTLESARSPRRQNSAAKNHPLTTQDAAVEAQPGFIVTPTVRSSSKTVHADSVADIDSKRPSLIASRIKRTQQSQPSFVITDELDTSNRHVADEVSDQAPTFATSEPVAGLIPQRQRPVIQPHGLEAIAAETKRRQHLQVPVRRVLGDRATVDPELSSSYLTAIDRSKVKPHTVEELPQIWESILKTLTTLTQSGPAAYQELRQYMTPKSGWTLIGQEDFNDTVLKVLEHTGCAMHIKCDPMSLESFDRTAHGFFLSGQPDKIDAALTSLEGWQSVKLRSKKSGKVRPFSRDELVVSSSTVEQETVIRKTWSQDNMSLPTPHIESVIESARVGVALPMLMLSAAVNTLVVAQTFSRSESLQAIATRSETTRLNTIADALAQLLCNPANVSQTSTYALRIAFEFLSRNHLFTHIRAIARAQFGSDSTGAPNAMSTSVCNAILKTNARYGNVRAFHSDVQFMSRLGVSADAETWAEFLKLTATTMPEKMEDLPAILQHFGLDHAQDVRTRLQELRIGPELKTKLQHIESHGDNSRHTLIADFVEARTATHGKRWLDHTNAIEMLDVLLPAGYWREALEVCHLMFAQDHRMRLSILYRFLLGARIAGDEAPERALQALTSFDKFILPPREALSSDQAPQRNMIKLSKGIYEVLFMIGRKARCWNMVKVAWQHACCAGRVSESMKLHMLRSIRRRKWRLLKSNRSKGIEPVQVSWALGIGAEDEEPSETLLARYHRDHSAHGQVVPINTLVEDIEYALRADLAVAAEQQAARQHGKETPYPIPFDEPPPTFSVLVAAAQ